MDAPASFTDTCPGCGSERLGDSCVRCGLPREDADALLLPAQRAYADARRLALSGEWEAAYEQVQEAAQGGLAAHPALQQLQVLCAEATVFPPSACDDYTAARDAARRGDWPLAFRCAERALEAAPASLPARQLFALAAEAMERIASEEQAAETDPEPQPDQEASSPASWPFRPYSLLPTWLVSVTALLVAAFALLRPLPRPRVVVTMPTPVPSAASPTPTPPTPAVALAPVAPALPTHLRRDYDDARRATDEAQARRWVNEALEVMNNHDYARARMLADAAWNVGRGTYLAEDALLIRAQATDNANKWDAPEAWEKLASEYPDSVYAPMALASAVRAARRQGRRDDAGRFLRRLEHRYPNAPEARRLRGCK